ncbi:MAG TPA: polyprenol monophosphomannose synthase [Thermoanaerobaculia bacterium]|nr:polyprenol monophosphomannose synthase [Thermoanaerobaculia bacterium]
MHDLLVVVPTYNEALNVERLLDRVLETLPGRVLVVDDASPDGTANLAEAVGARTGRVEVARRARKLGLGPAYLFGFRHALDQGYQRALQMDCDFSHDPEDARRLVEAMDAGGHDLVVGSRYVAGGRVEGWPFHRLLLSRGGNAYARLVLGRAVHDWTSGFKLWRVHALATILAEGASWAEGYAFQAECTHRALTSGLRVAEVPIVFRERVAGESKLGLDIVAEAARRVLGLRRAVATGPPQTATPNEKRNAAAASESEVA